MKSCKTGIALSILLMALPALAEPGSIGVSLSASVDGMLNPKLAELKVTKVAAGSAAGKVGIRAGDLITSLDDCPIPGCPADRAKVALKKSPGETIRLAGVHQDKTAWQAAIVVGKKTD
jgi:C-terminal processing protease CtpA/Prc